MMKDVANQRLQFRVSRKRPTYTDGPTMKDPAALGSFPVNHFPALVGGRLDGTEKVIESGSADFPGNDAISQADHARGILGNAAAGWGWFDLESLQGGETDVDLMTVGPGQPAPRRLAEGLARAESNRERLLEKEMVRSLNRVGTELGGVGLIVPAEGFQPYELPSWVTAFA